MKLPNGFGSVYRLTDGAKRRKPYVVKKTIEGKQTVIGYFSSYEDGISFLVDFNRDPSLFSCNITFSELYMRWKVRKFSSLSKSSINSYKISYKHCNKLHTMKFTDIRLGHLQSVIDDIHGSGIGYSTQKKVRLLMSQLYDYAAKYDIICHDYSRYVELDKNVRKYPKIPFTIRQVNKLWRNRDIDGVDDILIMIYTGLRVGEYLNLRAKDIKIKKHYFVVTKSKTSSGLRTVPIAKKN